MSQPIVIAPPAEVELTPAPIPADWILAGTPEARSRQLARSQDGASSVMAWSFAFPRSGFWRQTKANRPDGWLEPCLFAPPRFGAESC